MSAELPIVCSMRTSTAYAPGCASATAFGHASERFIDAELVDAFSNA